MAPHAQQEAVAAAIAAQSADWKPHRRISLDKILWDSAVEADYRRIPNDCPIEHTGIMRQMVMEGRAQAFQVTCDGKRAGTIISSIQDMGHGLELVIWCCYIQAAVPISAPCMQKMIDLAHANRCQSIRLSTIHQGLARWLHKTHGFRASEIIMRKDI
jgi:hypothetical protein